MNTRTLLTVGVTAVGVYLGLAMLVQAYPSLATTYAALVAAFVAAALGDLLDGDGFGGDRTTELQQYAVVMTALIRQTIRRLDGDEQRRAAADAERELMDLFDLDVEIDHEGLAAQAATPPDVDAEASDD